MMSASERQRVATLPFPRPLRPAHLQAHLHQPRDASAFSSLISRQPLTAEPAHVPIAAGGEPHAALEPALGQLQPVNDGRAQLARQHARAGDHQVAVFDGRLAPAPASTPGSATRTSTSRSVSRMSTGGSQAGACDASRPA